MTRVRTTCMLRLLLILAALLAPMSASASPDFWAAAREPGTHLLLRHARAPGTGDPPGFRLGDCATQRNLDDTGRAQARRIGEAIRAAGVRVDAVLSSAWCRALDTATLLDLGEPKVDTSLNSFFEDRASEDRFTAELKARLKALQDRKAVLVTHQVNITALTDVYPTSGEIVAVALEPDGDGIVVRGRMRLD